MRTRFITAVLCLTSLPALLSPAWATWTQTTFQIGGYVYRDGPLDADRCVLMNDVGLDWFEHWNGNCTLAVAARVAAVTESLRVHRAGFTLKDVATYASSDPARGDDGAGRLATNDGRPLDYDAVGRSIARAAGINNASTLGWALWDEPCDTLAFSNIGRLSRTIDLQAAGADRLPYVNLLPSYVYEVTARDSTHCYFRRFGAGSGMTKEAGYSAYLRAYLSLFDGHVRSAPLLSFDSYPFWVPAAPHRDYFMNLRLVRDAAAEYGRAGQRIPFWVVVQLSPVRSPVDSRFPAAFTFDHTRWQVYSALAYGAKGISYFAVSPLPDPYWIWGPGVIQDDGDTVAVRYSQLRQLNRELHNLGPTLMRLDPIACFHGSTLGWSGIDDEVFTSPGRAHHVLSSLGPASDSLLVGFLKDRVNGDEYLMVVNKALTTPRSYTLTLTNAAASVSRIDRASGAAVPVGTNTTTLAVDSLAPGQGELFRIRRPG